MTDLSRVVVVDAETSGLDPARHGVLSIGACFLSNPVMEGSEFEQVVRLHRALDWDASALAVNGFSRSGLYDPTLCHEREALQAFFAWAGEGPLILAGMNVGKFDLAFLSALMRRHPEVRWPKLSHRTLDMHSLAIGWAVRHQVDVDVTRLTTDAIYTMLGMEEEPRPHRALVGARMERMAMRKMLGLGGPIPFQDDTGKVVAMWTPDGYVTRPVSAPLTVAASPPVPPEFVGSRPGMTFAPLPIFTPAEVRDGL